MVTSAFTVASSDSAMAALKNAGHGGSEKMCGRQRAHRDHAFHRFQRHGIDEHDVQIR